MRKIAQPCAKCGQYNCRKHYDVLVVPDAEKKGIGFWAIFVIVLAFLICLAMTIVAVLQIDDLVPWATKNLITSSIALLG